MWYVLMALISLRHDFVSNRIFAWNLLFLDGMNINILTFPSVNLALSRMMAYSRMIYGLIFSTVLTQFICAIDLARLDC